MNNVVNIKPTRRVVTTAHRVTFEMVPPDVIEELFHAAIAVGWAADEGGYSASNDDASERMAALISAVNKASQYAVPVERVIEEQIC